MLAFEQMGRAAGELDDFYAALDRTLRVREDLAMFFRDEGGELRLMFLEQLAESCQDPRAAQRRRRAPRGKRPRSRLDGAIDVGSVGVRHRTDRFAGRRIAHGPGPAAV